jgi:hypothetical protein
VGQRPSFSASYSCNSPRVAPAGFFVAKKIGWGLPPGVLATWAGKSRLWPSSPLATEAAAECEKGRTNSPLLPYKPEAGCTRVDPLLSMRSFLLIVSLMTLTAGRVMAQVPRASTTPAVPLSGSVSDAGKAGTTLPPASVPAYPRGYTDKHLGGAADGTFPNGVPGRDIDNGTGRNDQPRANQAQSGAQPTRSILRGRKRRGQI